MLRLLPPPRLTSLVLWGLQAQLMWAWRRLRERVALDEAQQAARQGMRSARRARERASAGALDAVGSSLGY
jgi:hypothetical protein